MEFNLGSSIAKKCDRVLVLGYLSAWFYIYLFDLKYITFNSFYSVFVLWFENADGIICYSPVLPNFMFL